MRSGTDVTPQVNAPHSPSIQFIGIQKNSSRKAALRIILGIRGVPFQHDFHFPVAIQVGRRSIRCHVRTPFSIRHCLWLRLLQRYLHIPTRRISRQFEKSPRQPHFLSIHDRAHLITGCRPRRITVIKLRGNRHRLRCEQPSVAINVKSHPQRVGRQITPTDQNRIRRKADSHHPPAKPFTGVSIRHPCPHTWLALRRNRRNDTCHVQKQSTK